MILSVLAAGGEEAGKWVGAAAAAAAQPLDAFWDWFFRAHVLGARVADLTKFAAFLLLGLILSRLLRVPLARWLDRLTPRADRDAGARIGRGVGRSVSLLIFGIVLGSGAIDVLHLPGWAWEKARHLPTVLMAAAAAMFFLQVAEGFFLGVQRRWSDGRSSSDAALLRFIRKAVRALVVLVVVLVAADNIGVKVTGIVTSLGIGGAALALASQSMIANFIGTIEVVADKLYRVGDRIQFDAFDGFVEELGLRSTKIRALTGERVTVPNRQMAMAQIRNHSRNRSVRTLLTIGLVSATSHDRVGEAIRILDQVFKEWKEVDAHQVTFKRFGAGSLDLEVIFWARYKDWPGYNALVHELNTELKKQLDAAGISFTLPAPGTPPTAR